MPLPHPLVCVWLLLLVHGIGIIYGITHSVGSTVPRVYEISYTLDSTYTLLPFFMGELCLKMRVIKKAPNWQ